MTAPAPRVATADIYVAPGVAAYRKGDVVDPALVDHPLVEPYVSTATSKDGKAAVAEVKAS